MRSLCPLHRCQRFVVKSRIDSSSYIRLPDRRYRPSSALTSAFSSSSLSSTLPSSSSSSSSSYYDQRLTEHAAWSNEYGHPSYNNSFHPTMSVKDFIEIFSSSLQATDRDKDKRIIQLTGRITAKRSSSSKLIFLDLTSSGSSIQVMCQLQSYAGDFLLIKKMIRVGDIVGVRGIAAKTKTGELSIIPTQLYPLVPCLSELPSKLLDVEQRFRHRHLDMLCNPHTVAALQVKQQILSSIRSYLNQREFIEVDTPILWSSAGGALAKPFMTHSHALKSDLYLRVAPELFLKQLVIGGMDRVYEISKVFRNEGIDATHNPEFTTVELYEAYADYETLMDMTQDILRSILNTVHKQKENPLIISITTASAAAAADTDTQTNDSNSDSMTIDFSQPFARLDIMSTLAARLGINELPDPNDEQNLEHYASLATNAHIPVSLPATIPRILDKLISHFIEPLCIQPTFLLHHPICMSPLARAHRDTIHMKGLTERWELFIAGREYINAYSELNDSIEQRDRMEEQARHKAGGDDECSDVDHEYCLAMEYGLPPTAGWGLGVDRLCMLLTNKTHIRDVIFFPIMKTDNKQTANERHNTSTITTTTILNKSQHAEKSQHSQWQIREPLNDSHLSTSSENVTRLT